LQGGPNTYGYVGENPNIRIDFNGLDWEFVGWAVTAEHKWYSNMTRVYAVCKEKGCSSTKFKKILAYSWSTRWKCVGEPTCIDGIGSARGVLDSLIGIGKARKYAGKCGSQNGYQCFLSTKTWEYGQSLCDLITFSDIATQLGEGREWLPVF